MVQIQCGLVREMCHPLASGHLWDSSFQRQNSSKLILDRRLRHGNKPTSCCGNAERCVFPALNMWITFVYGYEWYSLRMKSVCSLYSATPYCSIFVVILNIFCFGLFRDIQQASEKDGTRLMELISQFTVAYQLKRAPPFQIPSRFR